MDVAERLHGELDMVFFLCFLDLGEEQPLRSARTCGVALRSGDGDVLERNLRGE
ncbi:hypothetical protein [Streptomyces sp. NPDC005125]